VLFGQNVGGNTEPPIWVMTAQWKAVENDFIGSIHILPAVRLLPRFFELLLQVTYFEKYFFTFANTVSDRMATGSARTHKSANLRAPLQPKKERQETA
jgi:hypothetical protein